MTHSVRHIRTLASIFCMKKIIIFILLVTQLVAFGQKPNQQPIPDFVLDGKTANELRFMRNEIFARYGYIFKSQDLTKYFNSKQWYNPTKANIDDQLTAVDKSNIQRILKFENLAKKNSLEPSYANESNSYFRVINDPETGDRIEKSSAVTFHYHCKFGKIKKTVDRTFYGGEAVPTVVYAETSEPEKPFWETTKYFNDLEFNCSYFEATNYGCCGAESYGELFNYESEESFLTFNGEYFFIEVPNSKIDMFIGYNHEHQDRDGLTVATLYLSTLSGVVNSVTFTTKDKVDKEDILWYFTPRMALTSQNEKNRVTKDGQRIQLWGSNFAKTLADINDFSILVKFIGETTGKSAEYDIPIIKGKLYGSNETNMKVVINLK